MLFSQHNIQHQLDASIIFQGNGLTAYLEPCPQHANEKSSKSFYSRRAYIALCSSYSSAYYVWVVMGEVHPSQLYKGLLRANKIHQRRDLEQSWTIIAQDRKKPLIFILGNPQQIQPSWSFSHHSACLCGGRGRVKATLNWIFNILHHNVPSVI